MTEQERKALEALDKLYEENGGAMTKLAEFEMTEEQQELYDIVSDWWDDVFVAASFKGRDASLVDLVNAIIDWKDKPQQYPVEGYE